MTCFLTCFRTKINRQKHIILNKQTKKIGISSSFTTNKMNNVFYYRLSSGLLMFDSLKRTNSLD